MKKTILVKLFLNVFMLSILLILFLSCFDVPQFQEQQKAKVIFTVSDNAARTVLPQASLTDIVSYKLLGGRNGAEETILVESFTVTGTSVALDPGTWNFTLNAYNSSGENILQGKVQNKQINLTGTNQISFSLSGINSGIGSIQIILNYPEVAGITRISTNGDVGSENFTPDTRDNFVYAKNEIAAGDYFINFELYRGDVLRTVVSELVLVRNGLTSSKTITLVGDDLKPIYLTGTITINPAVSATIGTELTAIYSGTETVTYQWNKDGSVIAAATEAKYTPNSTGSYTVTVSATGYNTGLTSAVVTVVEPAATVQGTTLQAKLVWLANTAENYGNYILEVSGDETIPYFNLSYSGKSNIVITLRSTDSQRTISFSGSSEMFTVGVGNILVLDNNITLQRTSGNSGTLVSVEGTLVMNSGSAINKGKVYVNNGTFTMYGGTICNNSSSVNDYYSGGGGVYVTGGTFTMYGGTISSNSVFSSNYYYYSCGGGVYVTGGTFTMSGGEISGNNTYNSQNSSNPNGGGGVYVTGGTFTMSGGTISGNYAINGSGVYVASNTTFTMSGGTISGNSSHYISSTPCGGGVYVDGGTFTMSGGTISGNSAESTFASELEAYGGGVYVKSGTFTMKSGEISDNETITTSSISATTTSGGAGVYVSSGTFNMDGGTISGNTSSSSNSSSMIIYPSSSYGGGVYVDSNGTFNMNSGKVSNNITTASSSSSINSGSCGGGVYVKGIFTIGIEAIISGNTANSGGGVYVRVYDDGSLNMSGGTISGNTANSGGGVYVAYGSLNMSNGTIFGNTATYDGGGVYGILNMSGGTISGNNAANNGGGVCGTLNMSGGTISANTAINGGGVCGGGSMSDGTISDNTASSYGGGVFVFGGYSFFTKTGGTIYGYTSENSNSNTVKNSSGTILNNRGHAVWVNNNAITIHREITAGPDVKLSWDGTAYPPTFSGGWEY